METEQLQIKDISPEFKRALKLAAAQRGVSLKKFVVDSLTEVLKDQKPIGFERISAVTVAETDQSRATKR